MVRRSSGVGKERSRNSMGFFRQLLGPLHLLARGLLGDCSPRRLALGFSLGMVLGLVPKGNLIALTLAFVLFVTRVNLGAGLLSAVIFSWLGAWFDPAADSLGHWLLGAPWLAGLWTAVYNVPLLRWTDFNNTVVLGNFALGLVLFYPVCEITQAVCCRLARPARALVAKYRLAELLFGAEVAANWRVG